MRAFIDIIHSLAPHFNPNHPNYSLTLISTLKHIFDDDRTNRNALTSQKCPQYIACAKTQTDTHTHACIVFFFIII